MLPETIEELMLALLDIEEFEATIGKPIPATDAPIVTRALFKEMGQRILRLERLWNLNETGRK
jgi:hypothetical protein